MSCVMKAATLQIFVGFLAGIPILLAFGQWAAFRGAQRAWEKQSGVGTIWRSTPGRVLAFSALFVLSLLAFLVAIYVAWVSFFVPPWQVLWPTAAALLLTGAVGLVTAVALLLRPLRRPLLVFFCGGL